MRLRCRSASWIPEAIRSAHHPFPAHQRSRVFRDVATLGSMAFVVALTLRGIRVFAVARISAWPRRRAAPQVDPMSRLSPQPLVRRPAVQSSRSSAPGSCPE